MAQRRINTIRVLFAGLSAAGAVVGACEAPEPFRGRSPGSLFGGASGAAGLGSGVGGGTAGAAGSEGLVGAGGRDQGGLGGDSIVGGGDGSLGSAGGTLGGGDGGGGHAAPGGIAAEGGASAAGGAARTGVGGAGGVYAVSAGGAAGGVTTGAAGMGGSSSCCVLSIQCRNYAPTDTTAMNAEIWISNTGTTAIPLRQIKVRYYYVNEGGPMALEIFDKAFKRPDGTSISTASSFSMTTGKLTAPRMDFSDIAIGGTDMLGGTEPFYFKMSIHDQAHSPLNLSNDYSNGPSTVGPCPHIVAFVGTALAAGVKPL